MAVSSLTKMSVPVDANPGNQGLLMPKLKYRFRVTMLGFGTDTGSVVELTKQVVSVARPNLTFEEIMDYNTIETKLNDVLNDINNYTK